MTEHPGYWELLENCWLSEEDFVCSSAPDVAAPAVTYEEPVEWQQHPLYQDLLENTLLSEEDFKIETVAMANDEASSSVVHQHQVTSIPQPGFGPVPQPDTSLRDRIRETFPEAGSSQPRYPRPIKPDTLPTLPAANAHAGSILQLGEDISKWEDLIRRWESNTITHCAHKTFVDNTDKVVYIENLLGESLKLYFQNWRMAFPQEYQQLTITADDTSNVTTQIRQMILGYDE